MEWDQEGDVSWVMLETEAPLAVLEEDPEETRQWLVDNLLRLQGVLQPYLDQVMGNPDANAE